MTKVCKMCGKIILAGTGKVYAKKRFCSIECKQKYISEITLCRENLQDMKKIPIEILKLVK